jgi:hypothetical protein
LPFDGTARDLNQSKFAKPWVRRWCRQHRTRSGGDVRTSLLLRTSSIHHHQSFRLGFIFERVALLRVIDVLSALLGDLSLALYSIGRCFVHKITFTLVRERTKVNAVEWKLSENSSRVAVCSSRSINWHVHVCFNDLKLL